MIQQNQYINWVNFLIFVAFLGYPAQTSLSDDSPKFYEPLNQEIEGWQIKLDPKSMDDANRETTQRALKALANHLQRIKYIVPKDRVAQLQKLPIWIDWEHELGAMQYHPSRGWLLSKGFDSRLVNHVHIPRIKALLDRGQWEKHPYVVLHELAHSYHDQVLGFEHEPTIAAYKAMKSAGFLEKVLDHRGREVRHYGLSNHKEYFAESTEAYFGMNDFFPFVRAELKKHDRKMYYVMTSVWGKID